MTPDEFKALFPRASADTIAKNCGPWPAAKLEPSPCDAPLDAQEVQRPASGRVLVRVTSCRRRLLDEDNLCEKYHVDLLRYSGILPSDEPGKTKIEVSQVKVGSKDPERTEIEITQL